MANAFAAKSMVTSAVMSATENWSPGDEGASVVQPGVEIGKEVRGAN